MGNACGTKKKKQRGTLVKAEVPDNFNYLGVFNGKLYKFNQEANNCLIPSKNFSKFPDESLIVKLSDDHYILIGDKQTILVNIRDQSFENRKRAAPEVTKGKIFYHKDAVYIAGGSTTINPNAIRLPFEKTPQENDVLILKGLKSSYIRKYNVARNSEWEKLKLRPFLADDNFEYSPDELLYPGACVIKNKLFFICGTIYDYIRKRRIANDFIFTLNLNRYKVKKCFVKTNFGDLMNPICVSAAGSSILIIGGENSEEKCSRAVRRYTIDSAVEDWKPELVELKEFDRNQVTVIENKAVYIFNLPTVIKLHDGDNRIEEFRVTVPESEVAAQNRV